MFVRAMEMANNESVCQDERVKYVPKGFAICDHLVYASIRTKVRCVLKGILYRGPLAETMLL